MKIDLYNCSKQFFAGALTPAAKAGILSLLDAAAVAEITQVNQVAYMLATSYHESAGRMLGIAEFGFGRNHPYGAMDPETGKIYYGRGIVQLTWKSNYALFGRLLGVDLVHSPELANRLDLSVKIMAIGMKFGYFTSTTPGLTTGVNLDRYIYPGHADFMNARKIINGMDCAPVIAEYAVRFSHLLTA